MRKEDLADGLIFVLTGVSQHEGEELVRSIWKQIQEGSNHIFVVAPTGFELDIIEIPSGKHINLEAFKVYIKETMKNEL